MSQTTVTMTATTTRIEDIIPMRMKNCSHFSCLRSTRTGTSDCLTFCSRRAWYWRRRSRMESRRTDSLSEDVAVCTVRLWSVRTTRPEVSTTVVVESTTKETLRWKSRMIEAMDRETDAVSMDIECWLIVEVCWIVGIAEDETTDACRIDEHAETNVMTNSRKRKRRSARARE